MDVSRKRSNQAGRFFRQSHPDLPATLGLTPKIRATKTGGEDKPLNLLDRSVKIARWRKDRYSADVNKLMAAAYAEADRLRADGVSPQQARQEFSARWQSLGGE
jgi:hypothetical protein